MSEEFFGCPRYREAYPRLDVLQASAAQRRGQDTCIFRDEQRRVVGVVRFLPLANWEGAVLWGELGGPDLKYWAGQLPIDLVPATNRVDAVRRVVICPRCARRCQILIYAGAWGCAACHRLHYRRQLVDRQTLDAEALAEAEGRLKQPRPKGMHQRTFAERRAMDEATVERLRPVVEDSWWRVASAPHQRRVDGTWMAFDEARASPDLSLMAMGTVFDEPARFD